MSVRLLQSFAAIVSYQLSWQHGVRDVHGHAWTTTSQLCIDLIDGGAKTDRGEQKTSGKATFDDVGTHLVFDPVNSVACWTWNERSTTGFLGERLEHW